MNRLRIYLPVILAIICWEYVFAQTDQGTIELSVSGAFMSRKHETADESYLYWGTDDLMNGKAKFVRAVRSEPLEVEVIADLGNLVRSLISTSFGLVFISEQKIERGGRLLDLNIHLSTDKINVQELASISRGNLYKTGFTYSRSSIASKDGVFFTYFAGNVLFNTRGGTLKWNISLK